MGTHKSEDIFVSVVAIASSDPKKTRKGIKEIARILSDRYANYEIICITDVTSVASNTLMDKLLEASPCIRVIQLSKQDSIDVKIFAGIDSAIGDHVVTMLLEKDPVEMLPEFIAANKEKSIVFGISQSRTRRGYIYEYGSRLFYWYNKKYLHIDIPSRSTYFAAFDRPAVNALTRTGRFARHLRYLARQIGYESTNVEYAPIADYSEKRTLRELAVSALELSTNYSNHPLRSLSWLGFGVATLNIIYAGYVIVVAAVKYDVAEGWTTTSLQLSLMFFFLFAILAVLSEYVGKVLQESRNEQPYYVVSEQSSKVSIADITKRNIVKE